MMGSIAVNFFVARLISSAASRSGGNRRTKTTGKLLLAAGITFDLVILFFFKYVGFFTEEIINPLLTFFAKPELTPIKLMLPLGISFYTFQIISYLVDVYKNPGVAQKNILDTGLYISFFPQLIAGPIVRYHDINGQIRNRTHTVDSFASGVTRFILGLSKKVLLANPLGEASELFFSLPLDSINAQYLWLAAIAYALQIYFDFSGYSDMAIGLGRMFGFTFLENFNYPYISKSITEFWRRWHISLSSWFRDYLYIPLGGNRKGKTRMIINLWIVFFLTGLWHGAELNFIVWGLGHGLFLFMEKMFGRKISSCLRNERLKNILGHIYALFAVIILWMFFRFNIHDSIAVVKSMFNFSAKLSVASSVIVQLAFDKYFYIVFFFAALGSFPWWKNVFHINFESGIGRGIKALQYPMLLLLLVLSMSALADTVYNPFLYFRF
jgi:alginate O-acetyltransferase complex protein AlgI